MASAMVDPFGSSYLVSDSVFSACFVALYRALHSTVQIAMCSNSECYCRG